MNNNEYEADLITLLDDENVEHTFEIIDSIEKDDCVYYALLPVFDDAKEQLELLLEVEDEELLDELAKKKKKRFEELFDGDDEDE